MKEQAIPEMRHERPFARELDRLSSLALSAGKDFNDELTLILNYADISLELIGPQHPAREGLVELTFATKRCAEITRCLLLLTHRACEAVHYAKVRAAHENSGNRKLV